jgi:hypothetical protein
MPRFGRRVEPVAATARTLGCPARSSRWASSRHGPPSGAFGFRSHVSMCEGPPLRNTRMHRLARPKALSRELALPGPSAVFSRARSSVGSESPVLPSVPNSRRARRRRIKRGLIGEPDHIENAAGQKSVLRTRVRFYHHAPGKPSRGKEGTTPLTPQSARLVDPPFGFPLGTGFWFAHKPRGGSRTSCSAAVNSPALSYGT